MFTMTRTDPRHLKPAAFPISTLSHYSGDCAMTFAEWAGLRCQTLLPAGGMADSNRSAAIVDPNRRAWEVLVDRPMSKSGDWTGEVPSAQDLGRLRLILASLRDAVALPPPTLDGKISDHIVWRVNSPFNCDIDTVRRRLSKRCRSSIKKGSGNPSAYS